jgi:hypothetical protein
MATAVEDVDLRLDDVDAGDLLGHRVLDLDARIDLDEVEGAGVGIHQDTRPCPRRHSSVALAIFSEYSRALRAGPREIGRRRALHDLLVAPLDRAVALEQMHGVAMRVAEDLASTWRARSTSFSR